jgi:hypothetical protein
MTSIIKITSNQKIMAITVAFAFDANVVMGCLGLVAIIKFDQIRIRSKFFNFEGKKIASNEPQSFAQISDKLALPLESDHAELEPTLEKYEEKQPSSDDK